MRQASSLVTNCSTSVQGCMLAGLCLAMIIVQASPALQAAMEFDRPAVEQGQWWRVVTGNFVHYGWINFIADAGVFAVLAWLMLRRDGLAAIAFLSAAVGAAILYADPSVVYRGISGVSYGLFAVWLLSHAFGRDAGGGRRLICLTVLAAAIAKVAAEQAIGRSLLPTSLPEGVAVASAAHVAGLAGGIVFGLIQTLISHDKNDPARLRVAAGTCPSTTRFPGGIV